MIHPIAVWFDFRAARFLAVSATQVFVTKLQKFAKGNTNFREQRSLAPQGKRTRPRHKKAAAAASLVAPLWLAGLFVSVSA